MAEELVPIARLLWDAKYRAEADRDVRDSWRRVAHALSAVEPHDPERWERSFLEALEPFHFLPGGRILAGAGTSRRVTLLNCFVMGTIVDSLDGIFDALKEGAVTMQQGGGVGYDFSTLRPAGTRALTTGGIASGPVSFMRIFDVMCRTMLSTGARRGAMMATLRCDHPDVERFIDAKASPGELTSFNLSLLVTDDFVRAARTGGRWPLVFPVAPGERAEGAVVQRAWPGAPGPVACRVHRVVPAGELWQRLVRAAWEHGDPGVVFIDRVNRENNLGWRERISATNPCGEEPLPPYGACDLGSIELSRFVVAPFSIDGHLDLGGIARTARVGVRMLDDVLDATRFPLERQREEAASTRRIGLGVTGLADAFAMLGLSYGSEEARRTAAAILATVRDAAYDESARIAEQKGAFPAFDRPWLEAPFVRALPAALHDRIARTGIRNSHLLAIAPTGSISLLAGNVSSGIEPIFALTFRRRVLDRDGAPHVHEALDRAYALWRDLHGDTPPPEPLASAARVSPAEQLAMQATLQRLVDGAISKTIRIPAQEPFEAFARVLDDAYDLGVKGCTMFRPNPVTGVVLAEDESGCGAPACTIEREAD